MFCSKCGAKAIEGAVFCEKCGAKLIVDNVESIAAEKSVQVDMRGAAESGSSEAAKALEKETIEISKPDKPTISEVQDSNGAIGQAVSETESAVGSVSAGDVYDLLWKSAQNCPEIKKVNFQQKSGITMLNGKRNRYFVGFSQGDYKLCVCPKFLFSIHRVIFWFVIVVTVSLLIEEIDLDEIYPLLGWCLFVAGVRGIISEIICRGEKKKIVPFIKESLTKTVCVKGPVAPIIEPLMSHPRMWFLGFSLPVASVIQPILYFAVTLGGTVILIVGSGVLDRVDAPSCNETEYDECSDKPETDQYMPSSDIENVSLSKIYTNEKEGFSFMYPSDWDIEDVEEVNPDALVSVACTGMYGTYARIMVGKDIDDGSYFAATKSDFEEVYSFTEGLSNVKVMDLSEIELGGCSARKLTFAADNDIGARLIWVQYFYIQNSHVYFVVCVAEEDNYDRYEPRFNAIMESYTITAANDEYEVGMQTQNYEDDYSFDKWILAGEYEGENVMPLSIMSINIYSSSEDDKVGNYSIAIPSSGIEYTGELCRESDRTFALVLNGEIYAMIEVVDETFSAVVIHYSEDDFECNYRMHETYPRP